MPSPFPGMDPYLEDPALWPDVHHELISVARELLLAALRPRYFIQIDERLYVAKGLDEGRSVIIPDLRIREVRPDVGYTGMGRGAAVIDPGIEVEPFNDLEIRESRIQVIDREANRVVTVLEILSPANKVIGSAGRNSYEEKRDELLDSHTNLVEIDLLRMSPPLFASVDLDPSDYIAMVSRWTGTRYRKWVWPMRLQERLKLIPVPVRLGDADAALDLQVMVDMAYERAGYDLRVDYGKAPRPPLSGEAAEWTRQVIEKGSERR